MTTQKTKTSGSTFGGTPVDVAGYAIAGGPAAHDLPSFWQALCRYRERHGLVDPQNSQPMLDDKDLAGLRARDEPRDFSFDDDSFSFDRPRR